MAKIPHERVAPVVAVGDIDPMSRAARNANLSLCEARSMRFGESSLPYLCTRAKGHNDSKDGPAADHVATVPGDRAVAVWPSP